MKVPTQPQTLAARVVALPQLPMSDLWALWDQHFPRRPPATIVPTSKAVLPTNSRSKLWAASNRTYARD